MMKYRHLSKVDLGFFPTPVSKLNNLTQYLSGPELLIKRDDLTGLALGGNKTRKLEYILADALANGCDTIITAGATQSNHCRQTAAAAAKLQLDCHLLLGGDETAQVNGNLLLDKLFGAQLHFCGDMRKGEGIAELAHRLKEQGKTPYIVPYGGSNELGAFAFTQAFIELTQQIDISTVSHIIFASSSGGTHAGLMLGKALTKANLSLVGINIDKSGHEHNAFADNIVALANETSALIGADFKFSNQDVILANDYLGQGYGVLGDLERNAIALLAEREGILLDPVYSGRAFGALVDMIEQGKLGKNEKVLFWHTGGAPALFSYAKSLTL